MSIHEDLKAYVDRELPPVRMAEIADAIAADPELAREVQRLTALSQALRLADEEVPVLGMEQTLRALERRRARPVWGRWIPLTALAASVVGLFTIYRAEMGRSVASEAVSMNRQMERDMVKSVPEAAKLSSPIAAGARPPDGSAGQNRAPSEAASASVLGVKPKPAYQARKVETKPVTKSFRTRDQERADVAAGAHKRNEEASKVKSAAVNPLAADRPLAASAADISAKAVAEPTVVELEVVDLRSAESALRAFAEKSGAKVEPLVQPAMDSRYAVTKAAEKRTDVELRFEVDEADLEKFKRESKTAVEAPLVQQQFAQSQQVQGFGGGAGGASGSGSGGLGGGGGAGRGGGFGGGGFGAPGAPASGGPGGSPTPAKADPEVANRGGSKGAPASLQFGRDRVKSENGPKPRRVTVVVRLKQKPPEP